MSVVARIQSLAHFKQTIMKPYIYRLGFLFTTVVLHYTATVGLVFLVSNTKSQPLENTKQQGQAFTTHRQLLLVLMFCLKKKKKKAKRATTNLPGEVQTLRQNLVEAGQARFLHWFQKLPCRQWVSPLPFRWGRVFMPIHFWPLFSLPSHKSKTSQGYKVNTVWAVRKKTDWYFAMTLAVKKNLCNLALE